MEKQFKKGDKVHYIPAGLSPENGIVRKVSPDGGTTFVVYKADGNWDEYTKYTAEATPTRNLIDGWFVDGNIEVGNIDTGKNTYKGPERGEGGKFKGDGSEYRRRKEAHERRMQKESVHDGVSKVGTGPGVTRDFGSSFVNQVMQDHYDNIAKEQKAQNERMAGAKSVRARLMLEIVAGIIPGQPIQEYTRQFVISQDEWEDKTGWKVMQVYGHAQEYMRTLWNPGMVNWVRMDWIYL